MSDIIEMVLEKGLIVKINGQPKYLNTNLTVNIPSNFLGKHEILEVEDDDTAEKS